MAQIDTEFFVRALKSECRDAAVTDCIASFRSPPGRTPRPELVQIAKWFIGLSDSERTMVESAMAEAADATLFGVLCVLDGVRAIEAEEESRVCYFCCTSGRNNSNLAHRDVPA